MSKKKKTGFLKDLWRVDYIDRMDWDESRQGAELSREDAERLYNELTSGGTKHTERDKHCVGYYRLVQTG